jgi:ubiquitin-conjugating enzyme E2 J1
MPAWGIRTAVVGLQSFWNQLGDAVVGVGYLQYSKEEKRRLARM